MASPRMQAATKPVTLPAIYARVSTTDQDCSLQLTALREWCKRLGYPKPVEYIDHGWSGAKKSRPDFDRMMKEALAGGHDWIGVWKLDRFSRSLLHLKEALAELESADVRFVSITQGVDTDPAVHNSMGRMMVNFLAMIAEFERDTIKERAAAGRAVKFAEGKPDSWNLTFGFERGKPIIKEPHAELILQLFQWRVEEKSITEIERLFTRLAKEKGVKPPRGKRWWPKILLKWLRNRQYCCEYQRGKDADGQPRIFELPRIVDQAIFDSVQRSMDAVKAKYIGNPKLKWTWTGFLYSDCGESMGGSLIDGREYMRCNGTNGGQKAEPHERCGCRLCRVERLEPVWKSIWAVSTDPERLRRNVAAFVRDEESKQPRRGRDVREQLAELKRREKAIKENFEDGDITREEKAAKLGRVREKMAGLEAEVRALGKVYEMPAQSLFEATCALIASKPEPKHPEDRRILLSGIRGLTVKLAGEYADVSGEIPLASKEIKCNHRPAGIQNSSVILAPFKLRVKLGKVAA